MSSISCVECPGLFVPKSPRQKFCSDKCRYAAKDRKRFVACAHCGGPMPRGGKVVPGVSVHNGCSPLVVRERDHGTEACYYDGCRCDACKATHSERMRVYRVAYEARYGVSVHTAFRRRHLALHGYAARRSGDWIDPGVRLSLYERDSWVCHLCGAPVDAASHYNDVLAPTLDHLVPRSRGGSDEPSNLLTAHRACNSSRGNRDFM